MREITVGVPAVGHFPVWEDDGITKHTGLVGTDFTTYVYRDSAPIVVVVTITEIGSSGEYQWSFTPVVVGLYDLQILAEYNGDVIGEALQCVADTSQDLLVDVQAQVEKLDSAATVLPSAAAPGSLLDRVCNKDVSQTYDRSTDSLEGIRDRIG